MATEAHRRRVLVPGVRSGVFGRRCAAAAATEFGAFSEHSAVLCHFDTYTYNTIIADILPVVLAGEKQDGKVWSRILGTFGLTKALHEHQAVGVQNQQEGELSQC